MCGAKTSQAVALLYNGLRLIDVRLSDAVTRVILSENNTDDVSV